MTSSPFGRLFVYLIIPVLTFFLGWNVGQSTFSDHYLADSAGLEADAGTGSLLDKLPSLSTTPLPNVSSAEDLEKKMLIFWDVWSRLKKYHPAGKDVTEEALIYGATKGVANALNDPYTYFLTPEESEEFNTSLNGELQGIGAELTEIEGGYLKIVNVLPKAPAEIAGLLPGDIIFEVDGESILNMTLYGAVQKIRGPKGTDVVLSVVREGEEDTLEVAITRDEIKVPSVELEELENGAIDYIRINKFSETTGAELSALVNEVLLTSPRAIVLDLRDNGGGYLDASVDVVSVFVNTGKVVSVTHTRTPVPQVYRVTGGARLAAIPLVLLINEQSASASEIVAASLQEYGRAYLIGKSSFGKGSVQELDRLPDGSSLRFTTAKWYTPNGVNVGDKVDGKVGVQPDEEVDLTPQDRKDDKDPQLDRAIEYIHAMF